MKRKHASLALGFLMGLIGCATTSAPAPAPVAHASSGMPDVQEASPLMAPSVVPSAGEAAACDPRTAPFLLAGSPLRGKDWAGVIRCNEHYVLALGQPIQPLGIDTTDFSIKWVAPDRTSAIGTLYRTGDSHSSVIRRWADERPDEVLAPMVNGELSVAPDGRTIAFFGEADAGDPPDASRLVLMRIATGERRTMVAHASIYSWMMRWSPDSLRILLPSRLPNESFERLAWTGWNEPTLHVMDQATMPHVDLMYSFVGWAPDSQHLLICKQNPKIPNTFAFLIDVDLQGRERSSVPIVDEDGRPETYFVIDDVMADNPLVLGRQSLLNTQTGRLTRVSREGLVGWSSEPGKLLHWRLTPEGPRLEVHPVPSPSP
ncbi:hypothetical protein D3C72_893800 [compost metagenome]